MVACQHEPTRTLDNLSTRILLRIIRRRCGCRCQCLLMESMMRGLLYTRGVSVCFYLTQEHALTSIDWSLLRGNLQGLDLIFRHHPLGRAASLRSRNMRTSDLRCGISSVSSATRNFYSAPMKSLLDVKVVRCADRSRHSRIH